MIVIIKHFGILGLVAIVWFPIMYIVFLLRCFLMGKINRNYLPDDDIDFVLAAHSKIGWGLFLSWSIILKNADEGTIAYAICGTIYVICVILSFLPFHRIFVEK